MGSQTLEILRQGVWASLTGGWFYDPHQGVFCNVVHLYLWLYLLCSPFVAYLYFPGTWLTWCLYCILTSFTILMVKLVNMAMHRLYDRAQTMSESSLKSQFFKITKETEPREDDTGIEMKIMGTNGSRNSVEHAINEASEENSILSIENVNSIIDLKVDVHRKNSSESIELLFYPPSIMSSSSQQDQQSIVGSTSVTKSIRSTNAAMAAAAALSASATAAAAAAAATASDTNNAKYLKVYPEHEPTSSSVLAGTTGVPALSARQSLLRKSSDHFRRRHERRRLERQSSLDEAVAVAAAADAALASQLRERNQSDTIATTMRNETFLHSHHHHPQQLFVKGAAFSKSASASKVNAVVATGGTGTVGIVSTTTAAATTITTTAIAAPTTITTSSTTTCTSVFATIAQRLITTNINNSNNNNNNTTQAGAISTEGNAINAAVSASATSATSATTTTTTIATANTTNANSPNSKTSCSSNSAACGGCGARLKRHRSSETHYERLKNQNLSHFRPYLGEQRTLGTMGGGILYVDELELNMGSSGSGGVTGPGWILGSSSDVYIEDDSYTKSDFGIEQLDGRASSNANRTAFLLQQQQQHFPHHQPAYLRLQHHHHHHHHHHHMRKDSNSTMSALQLPVVTSTAPMNSFSASSSTANTGSKSTSSGMKRRRHSNATSLFKSGTNSAAAQAAAAISAVQQPTVRRIKSAALEIACPRPSVSNLSPHPNSVEAINGQQQIKNPPSALLPPPSKCLVRNAHLNLCPKFGGSLGGSGGNLNFGGGSTTSSITALIEPVYPIVEQADEKASLDSSLSGRQLDRDELAITDLDDDDDDDDDDHDDEDDGGAIVTENVEDDVDATTENAENKAKRLRRKGIRDVGDEDHSGESDVGEAAIDVDDVGDDDDYFKDFNCNLEHILNDLQQTQNELDDLKASYAKQQQHQQQLQHVEESILQRQRLHSTDSETDNNGSRSPLLSGKSWESCSAAEKSAEKQLRHEIVAVQRHKSIGAIGSLPQHLVKTECDSGCPSSDCEQISASSKDMLLSGMDTQHRDAKATIPAAHKSGGEWNGSKQMKDVEQGGKQLDEVAVYDDDLPTTSAAAAVAAVANVSKNLGAIPKVVKYREINEQPRSGRDGATLSGTGTGTVNSNSSNNNTQLHKRRGCNNRTNNNNNNSEKSVINAKNQLTLASLTPSSTSSSSSSVDSISADVHKMFWLMQGASIGATNPNNVTALQQQQQVTQALQSVNLPPFQSLQFYQDALPATLNACPYNSADGLSLSERIYLRDKLRRSSKQISDTGNSSIGDFSHAHDLQSTQMNSVTGTGCTSHPPIGVVVSSSASVNARNVSNAATLSIQGLLNVINDERNASQGRAGVGNATAAILNVDAHIDSYCDYWRPACLLSSEKPVVPKSFYKYRFKCCGYEHEFKISMDRLELLALFDRDLHWLHILISVLLCAMVAYLGSTILQLGYYKDMFAFMFCAVIAGSQYSLVKSVQPDAASPIHGFNKIVAYSRAIYFSICGSLLLVLEQMRRDYIARGSVKEVVSFFGITYAPAELTELVLHVLYIVLLCFPLIFSLGLFPQFNTFLIYALEQIDMHIFGGNAAGSLLGSFLCVVRSILGVMLLYGPLYAALAEHRGTQYIPFSIFCAMLLPLGYHLSRSASDFSHLWALIKNCIVSTYRDDDDELSSLSASAVIDTPKLHASTTKGTKRDDDVDTTAATRASSDMIEMSSLEGLSAMGRLAVGRGEDVDRKSSKSKASSLGSSSQTLAKTMSTSRKAMTASNSLASVNCELGTTATVAAAGNIDLDINTVVPDGVSTSPHANVTNPDATLQPVDEVIVAENVMTTDELLSAGLVSLAEAVEVIEKRSNIVDIDVDDKISSSSTTNPGDVSTLTAGVAGMDGIPGGAGNGHASGGDNETESPDPLPKKLQSTVNTRLKNDLVVTTLMAVVVLGLHCSTVFTVLQPDLNIVLYGFTAALGLLLHYIIPQMRKHMPWLCFARPILRQREYGQFEVSHAPHVTWFEKIYICLSLVERNVLFPLLAISALTADAQTIANKFGIAWGTLIVAVCGLKFIRNAYSDPTNQYLIVLFTVLLFRIDFAMASETFLIDYFFVSIAYRKCCDFLLKLQFIVTYIAPWQITWGSAFHAFAQPFSVPHSAMLFLQAGISALFSTPLNPFLGSAIFLTSYVRPIKFWERDYNTRRIDHSNTRLSSQLERDLGADDNNLNSIFYEHLTRSLQHSLCGDLLMGRWGNVNQGDCFVLASDYLNCLVHIIELGNGLCTFQMRGLEFRGTYCQQREVEAITEDVQDNDGCCCCDPGHLPRMLSTNAMFSTRWLAWQVVAAQYVLEGYSISDNLASATLQVFEYRKVLITYYIKSIIYYVVKNPKLEKWLASGPIQDALQHTLSRQFVDLDPIFNYNLDEDFDFRAVGITRSSFCYVYLNWMNFCYDKRKEGSNNAPVNNNNSAMDSHQSPAAEASAAYNDSKSTPNLSAPVGSAVPAAGGTTGPTSTTGPAQSQAKSQSQQQLRARPQKSATMSGSSTVNSTEHIATSQSFANISRQTSESAPGLTGTELGLNFPYNYTSLAFQTQPTSLLADNSNSPNQSSSGTPAFTVRAPPNSNTKTNKSINATQRKEDSPEAEHGTTTTTDTNREKPIIKLKVPSIAKDSPIVSLCLALSLLARRSLATASHSSLTGVEFFLHGLHALFKGDFRITSARDEWVFADMELLHGVIAPAVKMALKLQQDHILNPDEFLDPATLYWAIDTCSADLVISHEADPVWRSAVLRGAPNLLALRHVMEDGSDEYRIIRLTKRFLSFRVIKLNRECVRGLWAGQQQELIYLRNRNPERGSIQNAKQALRNIINSSCDQPIGYPIYVSPLTTSYADTNEQLCDIVGGPITLESIKANVLDWWQRIRERCRQGCSSGSALETAHLGGSGGGGGGTGGLGGGGPSGGGGGGGGGGGLINISAPTYSACGESGEITPAYISAPLYNTLTVNNFRSLRAGNVASIGSNLSSQFGSDGLASMRSGLAVVQAKPTSTTFLAGLISREREQEALRESRSIRKSQTQSSAASASGMLRNERERRATLPIASGSLVAVNGNSAASTAVNSNSDANGQLREQERESSESPRYTRISGSSGNLGIGSIITTPGDYPRKSKGPICLSTAAAAIASVSSSARGTTAQQSLSMRRPRIELYKKVILVDSIDIYDCLDMERHFDIVWPSEEMRAKGGRLSWKDWSPCAGMVGHVVYYWIPKHRDPRFRSPFSRTLYLVEIGDHYVPVGEFGLREYNQILGSTEEISQHQYQREHEGLTPILGSSLESPTELQMAAATSSKSYASTGGTGAVSKPKIKAVSSSSSSDMDDFDDDEEQVSMVGFNLDETAANRQKKRAIQTAWTHYMTDRVTKAFEERTQKLEVSSEKTEEEVQEQVSKANKENVEESQKLDKAIAQEQEQKATNEEVRHKINQSLTETQNFIETQTNATKSQDIDIIQKTNVEEEEEEQAWSVEGSEVDVELKVEELHAALSASMQQRTDLVASAMADDCKEVAVNLSRLNSSTPTTPNAIETPLRTSPTALVSTTSTASSNIALSTNAISLVDSAVDRAVAVETMQADSSSDSNAHQMPQNNEESEV